MSLEECNKMARKLNIGPEELQEALWFLHHCVGLLLYYPKLEALKTTVICDIQLVFDSAFNLIKNTFTFEKVGPRASEEFKEKAQFSLRDLKKATLKHTDDLIPLEKLVKLLEHLNILTPLPHPQPSAATRSPPEPTYFMPCVLKSARASELSITRSKSDPAPLMLRYQCGYTPLGVFPAMITNLVSRQREDWELVVDGLRKNRVQFNVGSDYDIVTLISHPRYFKYAITRSEDFVKSAESLCTEVLDVIKSTLSTVTSSMNYNFCMGYNFGFECPTHPTSDHLCIIADEASRQMVCLQDPKKAKKTFPLKACHRVWFAKTGASTTHAAGAGMPNL